MSIQQQQIPCHTREKSAFLIRQNKDHHEKQNFPEIEAGKNTIFEGEQLITLERVECVPVSCS